MNFTRMHNDYLDPDRVEELTEEEYSQWLKDNKIGEPCPYYPDYPTCALDYADNLDADDIPIIYW